MKFLPKSVDFYGKPDKPKAYCSKCGYLFYPEELQILKTPEKEIWLCPRCNFKLKLRKSLGRK